MIWFILKSRCNGKSKAYETRDASWQDIAHNDEEIKVIDYREFIKANDLLKRVNAWRGDVGNDAFPIPLISDIQEHLNKIK